MYGIMSHTERLMKMSVKALKKEISNHNKLLKGYSKMKKSDVVALIIKNRHLFKHLFPSTTSGASTQTHKEKPPPPSVAKKKLKKVMSAKNAVMKPKTDRVRIYRFRVNGKEYRKTNNTWSRIIEVKGGFPIRQAPHLWTKEATGLFNRLKKSGKLTFSHNIKAPELKAAPPSPSLLMLL